MPENVRTVGNLGAAADARGALECDGANLRPCPDCGRRISLLAPSCPSCGRPFGPAPRTREGPFLQTLNVGCLLAVGAMVLAIVGGLVLTVLEVLGHFLRVGR